MVLMTYEGVDDEEELKKVPVIDQNNYYYHNVVSDSKSNNDISKKILMKMPIMKWKQTPRPLSMQKWFKP